MANDKAMVVHEATEIQVAPRLQMLDLQELARARSQFAQFVGSQLKKDVHFGAIPGTGTAAKPGKLVLLKPGAEEVVRLYMCAATYETVHAVENFETGLFLYRVKCRVVDGHGIERAQGDGSCSSYESKYRYRGGSRLCPACSKATIKRSKYPPRDNPGAQPGYYCFAKIGGCGANFAHDDTTITSQSEERIQNPDICDTQNTILKMASKRALVAAAINLGCCSDMFTQDLEAQEDERGTARREVEEDAPAAPAAASVKPAPKLDALKRRARAMQRELGWTDADFKARCIEATGKDTSKAWTLDDARRVNAALEIAQMDAEIPREPGDDGGYGDPLPPEFAAAREPGGDDEAMAAVSAPPSAASVGEARGGARGVVSASPVAPPGHPGSTRTERLAELRAMCERHGHDTSEVARRYGGGAVHALSALTDRQLERALSAAYDAQAAEKGA